MPKNAKQRDPSDAYLAHRSDLHNPLPAGKNTIHNGEAINVARYDQVQHVIKTERPQPIRDTHTTYKTTHAKSGYPSHYSPERQREPETKIETAYERFPGSKRHPYEVKSKLKVTIRGASPR